MIEEWFKDLPQGTYSFRGRWFKRYYVKKSDKVQIYWKAWDHWHPNPPLSWAKPRELKYILDHKIQILKRLRRES